MVSFTWPSMRVSIRTLLVSYGLFEVPKALSFLVSFLKLMTFEKCSSKNSISPKKGLSYALPTGSSIWYFLLRTFHTLGFLIWTLKMLDLLANTSSLMKSMLISYFTNLTLFYFGYEVFEVVVLESYLLKVGFEGGLNSMLSSSRSGVDYIFCFARSANTLLVLTYILLSVFSIKIFSL